MNLPLTLAGIMAMGKACLGPLLTYYAHQMGIGSWEIEAKWVDQIGEDGSTVGCCWPDPVYQRARIEIVWPPPGDVEQTIAHEVSHCQTAKLALLAGAEAGTYARDAWEEIAEQNSRGYVATRRGEMRQDVRILARAARQRVTAAIAAGRSGMGIQLNEEQARAMLAALKGEGDPAAAVAVLEELLLAALAGGDVAPVDPMGEMPMEVQKPDDQEPGYMRAMREQIERLSADVAKLQPTPAGAPIDPASQSQRQILTRTILAAQRGLLSAETERDLVARGAAEEAERMLGEAKRIRALSARPAASGANAPQTGKVIVLTDSQRRAAAQHKITPERYAAAAVARANQRAALAGRKV